MSDQSSDEDPESEQAEELAGTLSKVTHTSHLLILNYLIIIIKEIY